MDDKTVKFYLLGELDVELREQLEERLLAENELFEALLLAEDELVDDYVCGSLTRAEKARFETFFLTTPERIDKLRFARALHRHVATASDETPEREEPRRTVLAFWRSFGPVLKGSLAAGLLLAVGGGAWLSLGRFERRAPQPASFVLRPGLLRGSGSTQRVKLPSGATLVELRLELAADDYGTYRVVLYDAAGDEIWSQSKLNPTSTASEPFVRVTLPSSLLPQGDYGLKLSGLTTGGEPEAVATYSFRVPPN